MRRGLSPEFKHADFLLRPLPSYTPALPCAPQMGFYLEKENLGFPTSQLQRE